MKINHNNRDVDIDVTNHSCSSCYFHDYPHLCARIPLCLHGNYTYKLNDKNLTIFKL